MKPFQIFKPGKHVSANGQALEFSDADLKASIEAYDPKIHEAPITVGHPKDNLPAYGWIAGLATGSAGSMDAVPSQVEPTFEEMVASGRFKKRSASFYMPDSPNNPVPGVYYLRHVAFLGAQPPAVKGLKDVAFSEDGAITVDFDDSANHSDGYSTSLIAGVVRRIREWLIADKGIDTADQVVPNYVVTDLEAEARKPAEASASSMGFDEGNMAITEAQFTELQNQIKALKEGEAERIKAAADKAAADARAAAEAQFAEREKSLKAREQELAKAAVTQQIDALVKEGKLLPARKDSAIAFCMSLNDAEATVEFGEGDKKQKLTQRAAYLAELAAVAPVVNYGESAGAQRTDTKGVVVDAIAISRRAQKWHEKQAAAGRVMSFTEAVTEVSKDLDQTAA